MYLEEKFWVRRYRVLRLLKLLPSRPIYYSVPHCHFPKFLAPRTSRHILNQLWLWHHCVPEYGVPSSPMTSKGIWPCESALILWRTCSVIDHVTVLVTWVRWLCLQGQHSRSPCLVRSRNWALVCRTVSMETRTHACGAISRSHNWTVTGAEVMRVMPEDEK